MCLDSPKLDGWKKPILSDRTIAYKIVELDGNKIRPPYRRYYNNNLCYYKGENISSRPTRKISRYEKARGFLTKGFHVFVYKQEAIYECRRWNEKLKTNKFKVIELGVQRENHVADGLFRTYRNYSVAVYTRIFVDRSKGFIETEELPIFLSPKKGLRE